MPATPAQVDAQLNCICPGNVPEDLFRWSALAYLSALLSGGGVPVPLVLPTAAAPITQGIVAVNDASTAVLAANATRKSGWIKNISDTDIYVFMGALAVVGQPTLISPGASFILGTMGTVVYTGAITAIHAAAGLTKNVEVIQF